MGPWATGLSHTHIPASRTQISVKNPETLPQNNRILYMLPLIAQALRAHGALGYSPKGSPEPKKRSREAQERPNEAKRNPKMSPNETQDEFQGTPRDAVKSLRSAK